MYIDEMDFIERRVYSPMLHMAFILRGNIVVWMDIQEAMDYCINKMWSTLIGHFNQDELMEIEKKWENDEW